MLQLPTPDDYSGTTDIQKIAAALADPCAPMIYFQRMYTKVAGDPVLSVVSGKTLMGPGKWGGCGITSTADGDLFASTADMCGFTLRGLQLIGDVNGCALKLAPAAGLAGRHIVLEDCLLRYWRNSGVFLTGCVMYSRAVDCKISGNANAAAGAAGLYIAGGTTSFEVYATALAGYPTLIRSGCDGIAIFGGTLEGTSSDAIYVDGGTLAVRATWFDESSIGNAAINNQRGGSVSATGCRGLTSARIKGTAQFTAMP